MENPPRPLPVVDDLTVASERGASGIWSLEGDRLVSVAEHDGGPAVVLVRNEHVLVLTAELPPMPSAARRRAALPFAIEDRIADPLDQVHVALGDEVAPHAWLAGVVRHELMLQWTLRLAEAGLERATIVPDGMALPVPGPESWSVDVAAGRAMVRVSDGTGFALPLALLESAWRAAGEPLCIAYGDPLPPQMQAPSADLETAPVAQRLLRPALDLRQGRYAAPHRPAHPLWRRMAIVAAAGAAAHGAIAVADTLTLNRIAAQRDAEVRALAGSVQPGMAIGPDLGTSLAEMTPDAGASAPSQFLTLLLRTSAALQGSPSPVGWRSLAFDRAGGTLTIEVETGDIAGLQQVGQALTRAGLTAQPGAASTDNDRAVGTFVVRPS